MLEEEQEDETIVESLDNEPETTQEIPISPIQVMQIDADEDSYFDEGENPEEYEVFHLEEDETFDEVKLETSSKSNVILIKNEKREDKTIAFESTDELTEKMRAAHFAKEQLKKHKCPYCDKTFMFPSKGESRRFQLPLKTYSNLNLTVNRHVMAIHKDTNQEKKIIKKNHSCKICGKTFVTQFKVRRHMVVHQTELKTGLQKNWTRNYIMCQECMRKFHSKVTYERHTSICDKLKKSIIERPDDYEYSCVICADTFKQHDEMVDHMRNFHHLEGEQDFDCMLCNNFSGSISDMIRHSRYHIENVTYKCIECDKFYPNGEEIISHLLRHIDYKPFECTHEGCSKKFFDRYKLKTHMALHEPNVEKKFVCEECQRPFAHQDYLNCHIRRKHTKVKPYSCTYCSKTFAFHHDMNLHMTVHTGNKKHVCQICQASFTKAWSLKQHMHQHEITPPQLNCSICNFSTTSKLQYNKHKAAHNNKITYICEECDIEFKMEDELKSHMEEVHHNELNFIDANSSDPYSLEEIPSNY